MGRTVTPKYRIEVRANGLTVMSDYPWDSKHYGRATDKNLEKWRTGMNASFQPGGVNEHISEARGTIPHISVAKLICQRTGEVVAMTKMPVFEVVG